MSVSLPNLVDLPGMINTAIASLGVVVGVVVGGYFAFKLIRLGLSWAGVIAGDESDFEYERERSIQEFMESGYTREQAIRIVDDVE